MIRFLKKKTGLSLLFPSNFGLHKKYKGRCEVEGRFVKQY